MVAGCFLFVQRRKTRRLGWLFGSVFWPVCCSCLIATTSCETTTTEVHKSTPKKIDNDQKKSFPLKTGHWRTRPKIFGIPNGELPFWSWKSSVSLKTFIEDVFLIKRSRQMRNILRLLAPIGFSWWMETPVHRVVPRLRLVILWYISRNRVSCKFGHPWWRATRPFSS